MTAEPKDHDDREHEAHDPAGLLRIGAVALAAALTWIHAPAAGPIALAGAAFGVVPIFKEALSALAARRMTMELSMSIAIGAALAIGELFTSLVIILFVLVAEVLEGLTVERGRKAIRKLVDMLPRDVLVRRAEGELVVGADAVRLGDVVVVKPGGRIPVDGEVLSGCSFVDQATITGESMPVEKGGGSRVFAGTFNQSGTLDVRTTGIGRDTAFGRIIDAVERAEHSRAPIQKTADRLAGYLVYFALGCAALTFLATHDARATISVVIVAGACGIAAGTPLAILGAVGRTARSGVIVKGGVHIETLGRVDTVVFDKTGTVTFGNPEVTRTWLAAGVAERELLEAAALAERRSEHPVARAILARAASAGVAPATPDVFEYSPGMGIACVKSGSRVLAGNRAFLQASGVDVTSAAASSSGTSEVLVARDGRLLGTLEVADVLRHEAAEATRALREMGVRTVLLTGDAAAVAASVGGTLGVDEVGSDLLPEKKLARIEELLAAGRQVAMVGDGVNDTPALARASVGVAMCSGTDVAMEVADVVLLGDDLSRLVDAVRTARWCRRIILQNFTGTLLVDGLGMALASAGRLDPMLAAFIHVASELAFILNSTRLLPSGSEDTRGWG